MRSAALTASPADRNAADQQCEAEQQRDDRAGRRIRPQRDDAIQRRNEVRIQRRRRKAEPSVHVAQIRRQLVDGQIGGLVKDLEGLERSAALS